MKHIGTVIKAIRQAKGLTQRDMEIRTKIKREYLSKVENGYLKNPTLKTILAFADGLEVLPSHLIAGMEDKQEAEIILTQQELANVTKDAFTNGFNEGVKTLKKTISNLGGC